VLVVGANGMLGGDVVRLAADRGWEVTGLDLPEVDITDVDSCRRAVAGHDAVVNCAAWTAVDAAEEAEGAAFTVNAVGPAHLARACAEVGARLVHLSTDYVFPGDLPPGSGTPYGEDDPVGPRSAYGRTKAAGEWAVRAYLPDRHYLVRTAWLYGRDGPSFVHTMRRLALADGAPVRVVDDQHGQPTWTADVADRILALLETGAPAGTYHATSSGVATWFDLAREVFALVGADPGRVHPVPTSEYPRPAPRPAWSVLGHRGWGTAGLEPIGDWRERLGQFVRDQFGEDRQ
jgi:dTDP-4-dehydrorhamnose reductase